MPPRVTPASSAPTLSGSIAGRVRRRPGCFATTASPTGSGCVQGLDRRGRGRRSDRAPGEYRQGARARARADCTRRRESLRVLPAKRLALPARAVWTAFRPSVSQARDPGRLCRPAAGRAAAAGARGQLGAWPAAHLDRLSDAAHSLGSVPRCLRADRSPPRGGAARGQMRLGVALCGVSPICSRMRLRAVPNLARHQCPQSDGRALAELRGPFPHRAGEQSRNAFNTESRVQAIPSAPSATGEVTAGARDARPWWFNPHPVTRPFGRLRRARAGSRWRRTPRG
jgi:hypothetical protein